MTKFVKGFIGTGLVGAVFGVVVGVMYGATTDNWPGALAMFFGIIGMAYFVVGVIELVFLIDDWMN